MTGPTAGSRLCAKPGFRDVEPIFEPLWKLPEFQAMVAEIEADMAEQLARVREMEKNGGLEPIPELSATIQ